MTQPVSDNIHMTPVPANVDVDTGELFDTTEYTIPFPDADGHDVTDLTLRISGNLKRNRHDPEHAAFVDSLKLGGLHELTIMVSVDGKADTLKEDADGNPIVTHIVALKVHDLYNK